MKKPTNPQFEELAQSLNHTLGEIRKQPEGKATSGPAPFPVEAFPEKIQAIIRELEAHANFPPDYTAGGILFAASVAMGNAYRLQFRPEWEEAGAVYLALVGQPGTNKSHPLSFALKPIFERDGEAYKAYKDELTEYKQATGEDKPPAPILKKHLVSDVTPEALARIHAENPNGIGLYADELAQWFENFNRYNSGSEQEFWLSNWSGKPIIRDRVSAEPIHISQPFISVAGTIQPGRLEALGKNGRSLNGFTDRVLFAYPETSAKQWPETELPPSVAEAWAEILNRIFEEPPKPGPDGEIKPMPTSPEAKAILREWQAANTKAINETEDENLKGLLSKLEIHSLRLGLILQVLRWAAGEGTRQALEPETARKALILIAYFGEHGSRANALITGRNPSEALPRQKRELYAALPESFTTKEGVQIAAKHGMKERTFKNFIKEKRLFEKIEYGRYGKLY